MSKSSIKPISQLNTIELKPCSQDEEFTYIQVISNAEEGSVIHFAKGKYNITETITLSKSMRLVGEGKNNTILYGDNISILVESDGKHLIELEGISFANKGKDPSTPVKIIDGELKVKGCYFSGGVGEGDGVFGMSLYVGGDTNLEITDCIFEDNTESGVWITDQVKGTVNKSEFRKNDSGLVVTGGAEINVFENIFTENHVGVVFDGSTQGVVNGNTILNNRAGALAKGESTPHIRNNKLINNDCGIALAEDCDVRIEENEITKGQFGIILRHNAKAVIINNQIHHNSGEAIEDSSENHSIIGENEIYENGVRSIEDEENNDDVFNPGDAIAKALGSENLSDDPYTIVIPIENSMLGLDEEVDEEEHGRIARGLGNGDDEAERY